ncbi:phage head-tail adapter protein [Salimicrobium album]|uniref:Phage head-tail adapter protein n=1 Tax=Salimicrobium album TaxID=50717 RepID=A0A1H3DG39_9BACI|nr:phage head-tail adapter protein [Salimicrobium album]SDX65098.1 hypothetical protein SAMN04488081_0945 [Salimicrobium album]
MFHEKYKRPTTTSGDLRTPVTFYEYQPNPGPEPGEHQKATLFDCFAQVDEVWLRDMEQAKANGTLSDITLKIRDPHGSYVPSNKHYVSVQSVYYSNAPYRIKEVQPNLQDHRYINIIAERTS